MTDTRRSVPDWVGRTPDHMPPPTVRLRIFERFGGVCQITGRKIEVGDRWCLDHVQPLRDGGANVESNLHPVLHAAHLAKTAAENSARAVSNRKRMKHLGIKREPRNKIPGSKGTGLRKRLSGKVVRVKE